MKNLAFSISLLLLLMVGGWLRVHGTDWNEARLEALGSEFAGLSLRGDSLPVSAGHAAMQSALTPSINMTPGYTMFLTACFRMLGPINSPTLSHLQLVQHGLDLLTGIFLLAAVQLLLNRRSVTVAVCAIYMLHPFIVSPPVYMLRESLYGFVNALFLCAFIVFFKGGPRSHFIGLACGASFGICFLTRPALFPFLLLFVGLAGLQCFFTRKKVIPYLLVIAGCVLVLSPWWLRSGLPWDRGMLK